MFSSSFVPSLFLWVCPPRLGTSCFTLVVRCDFAVFLLHSSNCFASLPFVFSASFFPRPLCSRPHYHILTNISARGENVCLCFWNILCFHFAFGSSHRCHVPHSSSSQFQICSLGFSLLKHIICSSFFNWTVERLRCSEEGWRTCLTKDVKDVVNQEEKIYWCSEGGLVWQEDRVSGRRWFPVATAKGRRFVLFNITLQDSQRRQEALTFRIFYADGQTGVTFTLALLHGYRPLMIQTLVGGLSRVGQTLHWAHLLTQTTLCRTLQHKDARLETQWILRLQLQSFHWEQRHASDGYRRQY